MASIRLAPPIGALSSSNPSQYVNDKLDITNPAALALVRQLLDEYLSLFPGRYFDTGDDEYMSPGEYPLYPQLAAYAIHPSADVVRGGIGRRRPAGPHHGGAVVACELTHLR